MRVPVYVLVGTCLFSVSGCGGGGDGYGGGGGPTSPVPPVTPSEIVAVSGGGGDAPWGTATPNPLIAKVTTSTGAPVAGVAVNFAVSAGGGAVGTATATTDASGNAQTSFTLGEQLGQHVVTATSTALPGKSAVFSVAGKVRFQYVFAGGAHTCAGASSGPLESRFYCWGANNFGGLGAGNTTDRLTPQLVPNVTGPGFAQAGAGDAHTCALQTGGVAYCWGFNASGQLGDGTMTQRTSPVPVGNAVPRFSFIGVGGTHTCGRLISGGIQCWGENVVGQIGDGTTTRRTQPTSVALPSGVSLSSDLTVGNMHNCAIGTGPDIYCWGRNDHGQLGRGSVSSHGGAAKVVEPTGVNLSSPMAGGFHTCAIGSDQRLYCWGRNGSGQLGDGTTSDRFTPVPVSTPPGVVLVRGGLVLGYSHTCAMTEQRAMYCWGANESGQLGDGTISNRNVPTRVSNTSINFLNTAAGTGHTCATADYRLVCWGRNHKGQVGDGSTTDRSTPVLVVQP